MVRSAQAAMVRFWQTMVPLSLGPAALAGAGQVNPYWLPTTSHNLEQFSF
jgi:hypothetical protein